jgi:IS605 OrfB family transposase
MFCSDGFGAKGKVLYQAYLGKNIYAKRRSFMLRRAKLQSVNACKKLKQLRHKEHDYVKNAIGEVTAQIAKLAGQFGAEVAIGNLQRFPCKNKRFNRKVMRMPFYGFKVSLKQRCLATIYPCG